MLPTRRTQPYRAGAREPGPALQAMLLGAQPGFRNPTAFNNQRRQGAAQGGVRALLQRRPPRATADIRGQFWPQRPVMRDPHATELAELRALVQEVLGARRA